MSQTNEQDRTLPADEDLSARARIRQAALQEFAAHGFKGASIRGIARAAGVSPGLVQHHFGTKDGLREACDAYVMQFLQETQMELLQRGAPPSPETSAERLDELRPLIDYLIMALSSGSDTAAMWFNNITEYTHSALTSGQIGPALDPSLDTWAIAATQAAMALGVTAFYRNIQQVLDSRNEAETIARVGRARLFLAPDRIIGEETRARLAQSLGDFEQSKVTGKPPPASGTHDTSGTT